MGGGGTARNIKESQDVGNNIAMDQNLLLAKQTVISHLFMDVINVYDDALGCQLLQPSHRPPPPPPRRRLLSVRLCLC